MTAVTGDMVADALAALPTEPADIAALFGELGITGRTFFAASCPVANYLASEMPDTRFVVYMNAHALPTDDTDDDVSVATPPHVFEFIQAFDDGLYPELVA